MKRLQWAAALAASVVASTCSAAATLPLPDNQSLAAPFEAWMARVFEVPDTPDLDVALRKDLNVIASAHLARLHSLIPAWIAEERARSGKAATRAAIDTQTSNRLINEMALWRLESAGAAYDAAWQRAVLTPGVCGMTARGSYLGEIANWLQAASAADRPVLLQGERELLARWGKPRAGLPPLPARPLAVDEKSEIARLAAGDAQPEVAMAPIVATIAFAWDSKPLAQPARCAMHQWGLQLALHRGDGPTAALSAWRYAMVK